uniref:Translocator protein n=1 Tax=Lygus hesperus TaxID=30085 RepID=A0A0A9X0P1_LYGHE
MDDTAVLIDDIIDHYDGSSAKSKEAKPACSCSINDIFISLLKDHPCLSAIAMTMIPNFGFFLIVDLTEDNGRWYSMLEHPSWGVTTGEIYFPLLLTVNFLQGYAAFLVWEEGGKRWDTLPLAFYGANLFFLWIHFPIFLGFRSLKWGAVDMCLTISAAAATTYFFYRENESAGFLMIPYVLLLFYDTMRDIWMYSKNSRPKESKPSEKTNPSSGG